MMKASCPLDNAIRFTPSDKVEIKLDYNMLDNNNLEVLFMVSDSGIGVTDKSIIFIP